MNKNEEKLKMKTYESITMLPLKFGPEVWKVTAKEGSRLLATEMESLRRSAGVVRVGWTDLKVQTIREVISLGQNHILLKETIVLKLICIMISVQDFSKQVVPGAPPEIKTRRHPEEKPPRRIKSDSD